MAARRRAGVHWPVVLLVAVAACDFHLDVLLVPTGTSDAVLIVDIPASGAPLVLGTPVDDDRGEISVPFDRRGAGRIAVVQLEASLETLGLRVGPNEVSEQGQPLPDGAIFEAAYDGGSVDAFAPSAGLPELRVIVDRPCPARVEVRRSITTQASVRFLDVGTTILLQLDDGRTFDLEGELDLAPSVGAARLDDGALARIDADGVVHVQDRALPEMPGPRPRRRALIVGTTNDLAIATDAGGLVRWDGAWSQAALPGELGRRFALERDGSGRVVLGGTALDGIVDWPPAAAPTTTLDVIATALSFDGRGRSRSDGGWNTPGRDRRVDRDPRPSFRVSDHRPRRSRQL